MEYCRRLQLLNFTASSTVINNDNNNLIMIMIIYATCQAPSAPQLYGLLLRGQPVDHAPHSPRQHYLLRLYMDSQPFWSDRKSRGKLAGSASHIKTLNPSHIWTLNPTHIWALNPSDQIGSLEANGQVASQNPAMRNNNFYVKNNFRKSRGKLAGNRPRIQPCVIIISV